MQTIGPQRFTEHNPVSQNGQDFLVDVLQSNKLLTLEARQFMKQDAVAIFNNTHKYKSKQATSRRS